jgi:hypothetical protein
MPATTKRLSRLAQARVLVVPEFSHFSKAGFTKTRVWLSSHYHPFSCLVRHGRIFGSGEIK